MNIFEIFKFTKWIIVLIIIVLFFDSNVEGQGWYDSNWQYRREVTVPNSGSTLTDFQVKITLDASFNFTNAKNDGSDIRITGSDGTTLLPHWIEEWTVPLTQASIWVKIPGVPAGGTSVYLYYGNADATSVSNGDDTFEFFDDFESLVTTQPGYYAFGPASTIMIQDQNWEATAPHSLSVVEAPSGATYNYYGYYGLQGCNGIGMAGSNDLISWTKFPEFPLPGPNNPLFTGDGERWPSVFLDGSTFYMVHTTDYCMTSNIVYRESPDGLNWTVATNLVQPVPGDRNQNPCLFHDPNDDQYYLYWFRRESGIRKIMARTAATVAGLVSAPDIELLSSGTTLAAPNMLYYDGVYFLSTEIFEEVWKIRIYEGDSPLGPFTILPGNPVLDDGCACLFQTLFNNTIYEYYCKETSGTWTLDLRVVDPGTGRIMYEQAEIDETKWTPDGGTWSAVSDIQQDGTEGIVAEGSTSAKSLLKSSFSGSDYILEGWGRQIADRMWGFGVRTTNAQNTYALNIYEDLDLTNNLYFYKFSSGGNSTVWNTGLGTVDPETWYKLTVKAYGNYFDIYVDDVLKTTTPAFDNSWSSGSVALYGESGTIAQFNDIRVRKYAENEPLTIVGNEQSQSLTIDIAINNTACGDFEINLKPTKDITANYITNIQFTIKWPANSVNLSNFDSDYEIALQGPVTVENDTNHAVFASTANIPVNWTAGTEYTILSFSHDHSSTGYADFEIDTGSWVSANNGEFYVELLGLDYTGTIYGTAANVYLGMCGNFKVLLQGPYNGGGMMSKGLTGNIPLNQPYGVPPWNYTGTESLTETDASVIDWVLVELRSDTATTVEKKAALLLEDGMIAQYNNIDQGVHFDNTVDGSTYYIVVWHRNHMPVMTAVSTTFDGTTVDFTNENICYGSPNAEIELETGIFGMIAGDVTANGRLQYSGPGNDRGPIFAKIVAETGSTNINGSITDGYWYEDANMNNTILYLGSGNDRAYININLNNLVGPELNSLYTSLVPGAIVESKEYIINDGSFDILITESISAVNINVINNESLKNGLVDNIQFTLAWKADDNEILDLLNDFTSGFMLTTQGDIVEAGGINHLSFASVTPVNLPQTFNKDESVTVMSFENPAGISIADRLWIANDEFTASHNGMYYVSVWGTDNTGTILSSPLGINGEAGISSVRIYPNPVTSGIVNVEMNLEKAQDVTIMLMDNQGKLETSEVIRVNAGISNSKIDLKHLTKGIYYIIIHTDNLNTIKKIINL